MQPLTSSPQLAVRRAQTLFSIDSLTHHQQSILLLIGLHVQLIGYAIWAFIVLSIESLSVFVSFAGIQHFWQVTTVVLIFLAACTAVYLLRFDDETYGIEFLGFVVAVYVLLMLYSGYASGLFAFPLGVVMTGATFVGIIMFPKRITIPVFSSAVVAILILAYLTARGVLSYAPLFDARQIGDVDYFEYMLFYVLSQFYFVTPFLLIIILVSYEFLRQWREREQKIRQLSEIDPLTQLYNRRVMQAHLTTILSRPESVPVALIVIDLDFFKKINDTYGHLVGDRVLVAVAAVLREALRPTDIAARFGGEEFVLVLDGLTCHSAKKVAERCRYLIQSTVVLDDMKQPINLSASFGVACQCSGVGVSVDTIFRDADAALYSAKLAGRNRVVGHACPNERLGLTHPSVRRVSAALLLPKQQD